MSKLLTTQVGRFRILAFLEGMSFLGLIFITMPLKYQFSMGQPNKVLGMVHGLLFVIYVLAVIKIKIELSWGWKLTFKSLAASVVPFGTFYMDKQAFKNMM